MSTFTSNQQIGNPIQQRLEENQAAVRQNSHHNNGWVALSTTTLSEDSNASKNSVSHKPEEEQVAVVLGYYNGEKYLTEQLRSIIDQSHSNLSIFISDDRSDMKIDPSLIDIDRRDFQEIHFRRNESNKGFSKNFFDALSTVDGEFEYFSFSDQDDIWHRSKIADAITVLKKYPSNQPVLYCARTAIADESCQVDLGTSPLFEKPPSFANALIQSIGGGNTMVFNKAARELIVKSTRDTEIVSHDWWCYQIISGAGGIVYYDSKPCLKYRQHSGNLIGSNNSFMDRVVRFRGLFGNRFRNWNDVNLDALSKNKSLLTPENQKHLDQFIEARKSGLLKRLILCKRVGIYRQTLFGQIGLLVGLILNKV